MDESVDFDGITYRPLEAEISDSAFALACPQPRPISCEAHATRRTSDLGPQISAVVLSDSPIQSNLRSFQFPDAPYRGVVIKRHLSTDATDRVATVNAFLLLVLFFLLLQFLLVVQVLLIEFGLLF